MTTKTTEQAAINSADNCEPKGMEQYNAHIRGFLAGAACRQPEIDQLQAECERLRNPWVKVSDVMPPFDKLILLRGVINWKSKDSVSYFSDVVQNDYEILEYGQSGYLLKTNSDYLVINHSNPEEVASEYITHWQLLNEPEV